MAGCQVAPPSTDTSTPPTTPPPASVAVPVIGHRGAARDDRAGAGRGDRRRSAASCRSTRWPRTRPACSVAGCTPMSANRLTVACCMRTSGGALPRSWLPSRPHDHCTVPAPKTSAPLGAPVQRQAVRRRARAVGRAVVEQPLRHVDGRRRQADQARPAGSRCRGPRPTRSRACSAASVAVCPAPSVATLVLRQKRILPSAAGTVMAYGAAVDGEDRARSARSRAGRRRPAG